MKNPIYFTYQMKNYTHIFLVQRSRKHSAGESAAQCNFCSRFVCPRSLLLFFFRVSRTLCNVNSTEAQKEKEDEERERTPG